MAKHHFKSNVFFSNDNLNVDRETSTISKIVIANHGANKNGTYFNEQFLKDLVKQGNDQTQGVKCRFGHPNMCATSLGTFLGRYSNFIYENNAVYADLTLDEISKKTQVEGKGISMFEYVFDMAETNPDMFGNSIVISSEEYEDKIEDKTVYCHQLISFVASDLVDDPAATDSLFSNSTDLGVLTTQFLDENPQIFDVIAKDKSIITDFFNRYENYLNNYKSMSFLDKLKKKFGKDSFDVTETTATGETITIATDNEKPQVGDAVVDAEGTAIADGDITLKDGSKWEIKGGKIESIEAPEKEDSDEDAPSEFAEFSKKLDSITKSINSLKSDFSKENKDLKEAIEFISDEVSSFNTKHENLAKTIKSKKFEKLGAEETEKKTSGFDADRAKELREQRKNK